MLKSMRVNPLAEICDESWEHIVILTYTHDLLFFEREILRKLRDRGCRNYCIFVDEFAHQDTFNIQESLKFIGKEYVVQPVRAGLVFHPKIYLLINSQKCKLVLGSGNMTIPGFFTNKELFSSYEFKVPEQHNSGLLQSALSMINMIGTNPDVRSETKTSLSTALSTIISKAPEPIQDVDVGLFLHNISQPLIMQIKNIVEHRIKEITAISPYFDTNSRLLDTLSKLFSLEKVTVITQSGNNNLDIKSFNKMAMELDLSYELKELNFNTDTKHHNHAKLIVFHGADNDYVVWGSANFTSAALVKTATEGNLETVILKRVEPNWWKCHLLDDEVTIQSLKEESFEFVPSDGYSFVSSNEVKLLDANITTTNLELSFAQTIPSGKIVLFFNNEIIYELADFETEVTEEFTIISVAIGNGLLVPELPAFLSVKIINDSLVTESNRVWLNHSLELERSRTDKTIIQKREAFKRTDFTSRDHILQILNYIYNELKLEGKDLPKPIKRSPGIGQNDDFTQVTTPDYFPDEDIEEYENWSVNPVEHLDCQLYNSYIRSIYHELGLLATEPNNIAANITNPTTSSRVPWEESDRDRLKDSFKGFVRRYLKGITDEEYLVRVPITAVLWHYTVITSSFTKIIYDNQQEEILEPKVICLEYRNVHSALLKMLPKNIVKSEDKQKFIDEILPVVLADFLAEYFMFLESGEVSRAANCREWLEYHIQNIEEKIAPFKKDVTDKFINSIMRFGQLFGGLGNNSPEVVKNLINNSFGYIHYDELNDKLTIISGVSDVKITDTGLPSVILVSDKQGEALNRIVLAGIYWQLITKELKHRFFVKVSIINSAAGAKRVRTVFLYNKVEGILISRYLYDSGNSMDWVAKNISQSRIKDDYRHAITNIFGETVQYQVSDEINELLG